MLETTRMFDVAGFWSFGGNERIPEVPNPSR